MDVQLQFIGRREVGVGPGAVYAEHWTVSWPVDGAGCDPETGEPRMAVREVAYCRDSYWLVIEHGDWGWRRAANVYSAQRLPVAVYQALNACRPEVE